VNDWELITPGLIRAELARIGYEEVEPEGPSGATWVDLRDDDKPAILVPRKEQAAIRGYRELIGAAVERISWAEHLPLAEVIDRLVSRGDRFEMTLRDASTVGGRLPILRGPGVFEGFLQLLKGGARAEFRGPLAIYHGQDPDQVSDALAGIDLLAPEVGSFRLLAISSTEPQLPLDQATAVPDPSRRAVAATIRGLAAASDATDVAPTVAQSELSPAINRGMSVTLLKGLQAITGEASSLAVGFSVRWDPVLPPVDAPASVTLGPDQLRRIPALTERLREREPEEHKQVIGWVRTATADELAEAGRPTGLVIVEAKFGGQLRRVLIELPAGLFAQVQPGRTKVLAKGTLEKIDNRWHLLNPQEIRLSN
jgi:hypothetical protein